MNDYRLETTLTAPQAITVRSSNGSIDVGVVCRIDSVGVRNHYRPGAASLLFFFLGRSCDWGWNSKALKVRYSSLFGIAVC
jgi:hypothetical protein